jgi:hypothetical protein
MLCDVNGWGSGLVGGALLNGAADANAEAGPKGCGVGDALLAAATVGDGLAARTVPATFDP